MNHDLLLTVENINVHTGKRDKNYTTQAHHYHNWYEIFIVTNGSCEFSVYDKFYKIKEGTAMLLQPGVFHYYTSISGCEYVVFEVTAGYINRYFSSEASEILLNCFNSQTISLTENELFECIRFSEIAGRENTSSLSDEFLAIAAVLNILNHASDQTASTSANPQRKNAAQKLNYITNYISNNFREIDSVAELAKKCYISKSHMCRIFKEQLGVSVSSYINNVKINTARELLISGNMTILEIAVESGFNSTQYFHKIFKAQFGCSPNEFRSMNRKKSI